MKFNESEFLEKIKNSNNLKSLMLELRNEEKKIFVENYTKYLNEYYENPSMSLRIWHIRNTNEIQKCVCGKGKKFEKLDKGFFATCGDIKCKKDSKLQSYKDTCLEKYGKEYHFCTDEIKEKQRQTMLNKYGVDHNFKGELREKSKQTMKDKYGVESPLQNKEILEKRNKTCIENNGTLNIIQMDKTKQTIKDIYGVDNVMFDEVIRNKVRENSVNTKRSFIIEKANKNNLTILNFEDDLWKLKYKCNICKREYTINRQVFTNYLLINQNPCRRCNPRKKSKKQNEVCDFIKSLTNLEVLENVRNLVKGKELDIYIPELKVGFEFNGIYWHSDKVLKNKNYHSEKIESFGKIGIRVISIWEDDWNFKNAIIKSLIKHSLNCSKKIFARKCLIVDNLPLDEVKKFLNDNHLNGYCIASKHVGLRFKGELVCLMSIGKSRFEKGLELLRFVNKIDNVVVGGFSKILKFFKDLYKGEKLISYRNKDFGLENNNVYLENGFKKLKDSVNGYWYVIDGIRYNRMNFTKKKLVEMGFDSTKTETQIMVEDIGAYKVYDSGNEKYEIIL